MIFCKKKRTNHFTLIELLIVIAIISILITILLPSIGGIKESANTLSCTVNLKNIVRMNVAYRMDNNNMIYPAIKVENEGAKETSWIANLSNEYNDKGWRTFLCPVLSMDEGFKPHGAMNFTEPVLKASYMFNSIHNWTGVDISTQKNRSFGFGRHSEEGINYNSIRDPANAIMTVDGTRNLSSADGKSIVSAMETDHGEFKEDNSTGKRDVGDHHNGGFNAIMGDGSVKLIKEKSDPNDWVIFVDE